MAKARNSYSVPGARPSMTARGSSVLAAVANVCNSSNIRHIVFQLQLAFGHVIREAGLATRERRTSLPAAVVDTCSK